MFALEVGYLRKITIRDAAGVGVLPPVHVLLTHCYFCFPELLLHFSAFTTFLLKLILNIETEPIFLPRPHGREVTLSQMLRHLWSKVTCISRSLIKVSICIQYFFCFQNQIQFYHSEFQAEKHRSGSRGKAVDSKN